MASLLEDANGNVQLVAPNSGSNLPLATWDNKGNMTTNGGKSVASNPPIGTTTSPVQGVVTRWGNGRFNPRSPQNPSGPAKGDGLTDDTASLQAAINAADGANKYGVVEFDSTGANFFSHTGLTITGANAVWLELGTWGTILKTSGAGIGVKVGSAVTDQTADVRILGGQILGTGASSHGIQALRMHQMRVEGVRILSHGGDGVNAQGCYASWWLNNHSNNNTGWGYHFLGLSGPNSGSDFTLLLGNRALANTAGGIYFDGTVYGGDGVRVEMNDIEGNAVGLRFDVGSITGWDSATIRANYFESQTGRNMLLGTDAGTSTMRSPLIESNIVGPGTGTTAANACQWDRLLYAIVKANKFATDVTVTAFTDISESSGNVNTGGAALPSLISSQGNPASKAWRVVQDATTYAVMQMASNAVYTNWALGSTNQIYPGAEGGGLQVVGGLLHSTGIPSNANGNNNDWAISDNGHLYFKTAGAWVQKL